MKLDHTNVVFMRDEVDSRPRCRRMLAKDCSLCNEQWIHSEYHPILRFVKKIIHPSKVYCQCDSNH
jgi:hypothetical protein